MNTIKIVIALLSLIPWTTNAQDLLSVEHFSYPHQVYSFIEHQPVEIYATTIIALNMDQEIWLEITTESKDFPDSWNLNDVSPDVNENYYFEGSNENIEIATHIGLQFQGVEDLGTGVEKLRIIAKNADSSIVANLIHEVHYTINAPEIPEPTFIITTFEFDSTIVDTIYAAIDFNDPFSKTFNAHAEIPFMDFYWIERPIVFEPIEIILENVENLECMHHEPDLTDPSLSWCNNDVLTFRNNNLYYQDLMGNIGPGNDYRMEFLLNVYDPLDSINSNQQVRIIGKDAECIYGKEEQLVDSTSNYVYTCPGGSVTLNALPEFGNLTWDQQINENTIQEGNSVTYDDIQESFYLRVTKRDNDGCLLVQYIFVEIEERYEELVDGDGEGFEVCIGSDLTINLLPGYEEALWYNEMEGTTTMGDSYTLTDIQGFNQLRVRALNPDGCFSFQDIYISINEGVIYEEIIQDSSWQVCPGGDLVLELGSEYSEVVWIINNMGQFITGNILELTNVTDAYEIELSAVKNNGCTYMQFLYIYPENDQQYNPDILATDLDFEHCSKIALEAASGYDSYAWYSYINGNLELISEDQELLLDYTTNPGSIASYFELFAFGEEDCGDFYDFSIRLKEPEDKALIDAPGLGDYCAGDEIEITVIDTYESYQWSYQGETSTGPTITFDASAEPLELLALDADGCAYRDVFYSTVENLAVPSLCLITNDQMSGNNVLLWEDPANEANISKYLIYREGNVTNDFIEIGELDFEEDNLFIDKDSDPAQQAYKYHIRATNRCGELSEPSNVHKTIHLTINQGTNDNVNLIWDSYEGISYDQIKIYRGSSLDNLEEYLGLPGNAFSFTDQNPPAGNVYYQIEITTEIECEIGKALYKIKSNVAAFETIGDSTDELGLTGKIYPNPFADFLILELEETIELQIVAPDGRRMQAEQLTAGNHKVSTSNLLPGAYIIKVISGNKIFAQTFVKT